MQTKTQNLLLEIFAALLILLFLYTAASKLQDHERFVAVLHKSPLLADLRGPVSWSVPLAEIGIAVLLFLPTLRIWGFACSFILMALFALYIAYMLAFAPQLPCACGGVIREMSWGQHLVFNLFFTAISALGWHWERKKIVVAITQA